MSETIPPLSVSSGINGQARVCLSAPDSACAEIYLNGGQVTAWSPAGGEERLFNSSKSVYAPGTSVRGGVPVVFPQFGKGPLAQHGFARRMVWEYFMVPAPAGCAAAGLRLRDSAETRSLWPFAFQCELRVIVGGPSLNMLLSLNNPGPQPFTFTAGLHTYLRVAEITQTALEGLEGAAYLDTVGPLTERIQTGRELRFTSEVDRIYWNPPARLLLREANRSLAIESEGFPHAVVWNPWIEKSAALADMETEGYRRMLCVEAVATGTPLILQPGETWQGTQRLTA